MRNKKKIAILASGKGTTAEALLQKVRDGLLAVNPVLIIHNNPNAGVVNQATVKELGVKTLCINTKMYPRGDDGTKQGSISDAESDAMVAALQGAEVELVLQLGYMKHVRGALLETYGFIPGRHSVAKDARLLNVHPGPLPQTKGLYGSGVHQRVYELYQHGELDKTGPTLHTVSKRYDDGPVVRYFDDVDLSVTDTPETIEHRVREIERDKLYLGVKDFIT